MRLSRFILDHREAILKDWDDFAESLLPAARALDRAELRNSAAEILKAIADDIEAAQTRDEQKDKSHGRSDDFASDMQSTARIHAGDRLAQRFDLLQVIAEYRALRASVTRHWTDQLDETHAKQVAELTRFNEAIDESLTAAVAWFDVKLSESETTARELEERLAEEKAEALRQSVRAKDEFLAVLAHELRNPLAPLRSALDILERAPRNQDLQDRVVPMMGRQLTHLIRLVDDLLDVARVSWSRIQLQRRSIDLHTPVRAAIEQIRPLIDEKEHRLQLEFSNEPSPVYGDTERLTQVVTNLLTNAAKYTDRGGTITVTTSREDGQACISVRDTGRGIGANDLSGVFQLFSKVSQRQSLEDEGGLGVGLTLSRELVALHGGTLEARSDGEGRGSEFLVRLPLSSPQHPEGDATEDDGRRNSQSRRVLVVDDNVDAAEALQALLEFAGHVAEAAYSGPAALQALERFEPEVVFLDLGMPGMDGIEVAREIRAMPNGDGVRIVAVTGWGQDTDKARTRQAGFDGHLVKPVDSASLMHLLSHTEPS